MQQRKYYFQGVPNQVGKLQKFRGVWRSDKKPLEGKFQGMGGGGGGGGLKQKCPPSWKGGMDIFLNYTMHVVHS